MKKVLSLLMILSIVLCFASCSKKEPGDAPDGMILASNPDISDYNLYVPDDWSVYLDTGVTFAQSSEKTTNVSVAAFTNNSISAEKDPIDTAKKFWEEENLPSLLLMFDEKDGEPLFEKTGEEATTLKAGSSNKSAVKYTYKGTVKGTEKKLAYMQVISYYDDYFYIITFTSTEDSFEKNLDTFDKILKNFEFR